jgi:GNAT superfamily N-acetyltransferase
MKIKDLNEENLKDIVSPCICKEWAERIAKLTGRDIERVKEAFSKGTELKIDWIRKRLPLGYKAKIAYEKGKPIGFIDYLPIEIAQDSIMGHRITVINCIQVVQDYKNKGYGKTLLESAEANAEKISKGIAVVAHNHPRWMPASFFTKRGYRVVDERNDKMKRILMVKTFGPFQPPRFVKSASAYNPKLVPGKVTVEIFYSGACPQNLIFVESLREMLVEFKDKVIIKEVMTNDLPSVVTKKYGHSYGVYINGKPNFWLLGASRDEISEEISSILNKERKI